MAGRWATASSAAAGSGSSSGCSPRNAAGLLRVTCSSRHSGATNCRRTPLRTSMSSSTGRARHSETADAVQTVASGYLLRDGPEIVVDAERFEALGRSAGERQRGGDSDAALSAARAALAVWGEPFPHDAYAVWAQPHRDRLERLHQEVLEIAAAAAVATGDSRAAVALAAEAVALQPLREPAHLLLMRAYAADGDQAAAVTSYLDLRRVLADELGIDPSGEATDLYEELLRGTLARRPGRTRRRPTLAAAPFVGRERELELLSAFGNDGRVAVVAGRSGLGKSRLLESLIAASDRPVLLARALMPERDEAYGLVRTLLQSAPVLALDIPATLSETTRAAMGGFFQMSKRATCRKRRPEIAASADPAGRVAGHRSHRALTRRRRRPAVGRLEQPGRPGPVGRPKRRRRARGRLPSR